MAAISQTDIVNGALALLGSTERVNSINDTQSNSARRAKAVWRQVLEPMLADHPWNFAIRRAELNEGPAPKFGWSRSYALPVDCVRWLPPAEGEADYFSGEREGQYILTDAEAPLRIRYIAFVDESPKFPAPFAKAVQYALAAEMAEGVTSSQGIRDRMADMADYWLAKAKRKDGLETGRRRRGAVRAKSDWLKARNRPYYYLGR